MRRPNHTARLPNFALSCACGVLMGLAPGAHGSTLTLASTPLFLGGVEPNVFFMLDDSGSMDFEVLTKPYYDFQSYWYDDLDETSINKRRNGRWYTYASSGWSTGLEDVIYILHNEDNLYKGDKNQPDVQRSSHFFEYDWRGVSPSFNVMYYDPSSTYEPWVGHTDASFTSARSDPQPGSDGYDYIQNLGTVDIPFYGQESFVYELAVDDASFAGFDEGLAPDGPWSYQAGGNGLVDVWDSHVRLLVGESAVRVEVYTYDPLANPRDCLLGTEVEQDGAAGLPALEGCMGTQRAVTELSGSACYDILGANAQAVAEKIVAGTAAVTDTDGTGCRTIAEAQQNIANWYAYSRRRSYVAKGAIAELLAAIPGFRYGLSVINEYDNFFVETPAYGSDYISHNQSLLQSLYSFDWPSRGTPLRDGLKQAGQYYEGGSSPIVESCQKNFTLLFTDGYYNKSVSFDKDTDGDGVLETVADIAYHYYERDLKPDMANDVEPDAIDPATHQHMVTMTVAFGVSGLLADKYDNTTVTVDEETGAVSGSGGPDGLPDVRNDGTLWQGGTAERPNIPIHGDDQEDEAWADADVTGNSEDPQKIDDLWHAAYNSRGVYINAQTPEELVAAMRQALAAIEERTSSASSVALNSGSLNENTRTYQARFDSRSWTGELVSIPISDGSGNATCELYEVTEAGPQGDPPGALCEPEWHASAKLSGQDWSTGREILTWHPGSETVGAGGVPFRWDNLSGLQQTALRTDPQSEAEESEAKGAARLNYLRGDDTHEGGGTYNFRARQAAGPQGSVIPGKLGDIVHSSPIYVGEATFLWPDSLKTGTIANPGSTYTETYSAFRTRVKNRTPVIYVGANDGMLHGFNAYFDADNDAVASSGQEVLAYVPYAVHERLAALTHPDYEHEWYVNGEITRGDVYFESAGEWRTVIVGTLRGGGQGVYALDVTSPGTGANPEGFTEAEADAIVLWEFTDADNPNTKDAAGNPLVDGDPDLGFTYSQAAVARMANGRWAAIFGNGHNNTEEDGSVSSDGNAVLYIVDIETGELISKLDTLAGTADDPYENGRPNALASPTPIDRNRDHFVETVYAGDLFGNVWKFDVSSADPADWEVASPSPLFSAVDGDLTSADKGSYSAQPITTKIVVGRHPTQPGGVMLYFGTGKYVEVTDNSSTGQQTQTFYGIWDSNDPEQAAVSRTDLLEQKILQELEYVVQADGSLAPPSEAQVPDHVVRLTSDELDPLPEGETGSPYTIDWSTHRGWLMDLINHGAGTLDNRGERVNAAPLLRNERIIFVTTLPNESPCSFGGDSFLMELDAKDGSRLAFTPFDLNNDREFSEQDYITVTINSVEVKVPVSGRMSTEGIIQQPGVLVAPGAEYKYASGSAGGIDITVENPGPLTLGRQSWRQLR